MNRRGTGAVDRRSSYGEFPGITNAFLAGDALIRVAGEAGLADRLTQFAADPYVFLDTGCARRNCSRRSAAPPRRSTDAVLSALPCRGARR